MKRHLLLFSVLLMLSPLMWTGCKQEEPNPSLLEYLESDARLSSFRELMALTQLDTTLNGSFFYTLLAPDNDAFAAFLAAHSYGSLSEVPMDSLRAIAIYHIQIGWIERSEFTTNYYTTPAPGLDNQPLALYVQNDDGEIVLNNVAKMAPISLTARDGQIHLLDGVMTPPTLLDLLSFAPRFETMYEGMLAAGYADTLAEAQEITLFAVRNEEFAAYLNEVGADSLGEFTRPEQRDLLGYHIMDEFKTYRDMELMAPAQSFPTMNPDRDVISILNSIGTILLNDRGRLLLLDIHGTNGVMHLVDRVLEIP
ncbi:MAG: fasciclin domain-containing protein [Bacteroidetes bacterium]|nr:MAG: fasciclin domain-containing protein [Bacteroidota bacterium]